MAVVTPGERLTGVQDSVRSIWRAICSGEAIRLAWCLSSGVRFGQFDRIGICAGSRVLPDRGGARVTGMGRLFDL